jgi:hypothetical protein
MMYDISLRTAGIIAGAFLLLVSLPGLVLPGPVRAALVKFPRSKVAGVILLTMAFIWSFWLLVTMEMGEFSGFRRPLMIALPIGYILVLRFVNEFLAVRALGILLLLAAEPLLSAAFLRYEQSRLLVTVLAYIIIVKGLFYVTMPYLLRDYVAWVSRSTALWLAVNALTLGYGAVILGYALTQY